MMTIGLVVGDRAGTMTGRAGSMIVTGRRVRGGMMTGRRVRAGLMMTGLVGGDREAMMPDRRDRAGMMTGRVVGDRAAMMPGRRDPAGTMTGRAGSMIVTGRRVRGGIMTGRRDPVGMMTGRAGMTTIGLVGGDREAMMPDRRDRAGMMTGRVVGVRAATMTGRRGPVGMMTTDPSGRSASRGPRRSVVRRKSVVAREDGARTLSRRDPLNGRSSCGWTRVPPHARSASRRAFVRGRPVARRRAAARRCARSTP